MWKLKLAGVSFHRSLADSMALRTVLSAKLFLPPWKETLVPSQRCLVPSQTLMQYAHAGEAASTTANAPAETRPAMIPYRERTVFLMARSPFTAARAGRRRCS